MNWYTLYFINFETLEIIAQWWRAKNAKAAVKNWRRYLRHAGSLERGAKYYIEIYDGRREHSIPEGIYDRALKGCKVAR